MVSAAVCLVSQFSKLSLLSGEVHMNISHRGDRIRASEQAPHILSRRDIQSLKKIINAESEKEIEVEVCRLLKCAPGRGYDDDWSPRLELDPAAGSNRGHDDDAPTKVSPCHNQVIDRTQ